MSPQARKYALLFIAGLVVAYVRNVVQYGRYSWGSIGLFLSFWVAHYIAVIIVVAASHVVIKNTEKIFFEYNNSEEGLTWEQSIVYASLIIIISAIFILLLAHWKGGGSDFDGW